MSFAHCLLIGAAFTVETLEPRLLLAGQLPLEADAPPPAMGRAFQPAAVSMMPATWIEPDLVANRLSGVAPLAVHFDATGTTSTMTPYAFHELNYSWDFGDPGSGLWAISGLSRNHDEGPVAAHVFEQPGVYTVMLTVRDGLGYVQQQVDIEVLDPDVVFAGTQTVCFSPTGDFTGAPEGALHVVTGDFGAVMAYAQAGRRLLLARGGTWTNSSARNVNNPGAGIVGAFGVGAKPVIVSSSTLFSLSSRTPTMRDWRFMDLDLRGQSGRTGFSFGGTADDVTILRVDMTGFGTGVSAPPSILDYNNANGYPGHTLYDGLAVVDSTVDGNQGGGGNNGMYIAGQRLMILGTSITNCQQVEHSLRSPWMIKAVLSHSLLAGAAPSKHQLKLHARGWNTSGLGHNSYTEQVVIRANVFEGGNNAWTITLGPQNKDSDERFRDILIEGNLFTQGPETYVDLLLWVQDTTVRNNVFHTGAGLTAISIGPRGVEPPPQRVRVYHNTFNSTGQITAVNINAAASDTVVQNNLLAGAGQAVKGSGTNLLASHNLVTAAPYFADPSLPGWLGSNLRGDSPAVNAGTAVPVWTDLLGRPRPMGEAPDLGAFEYHLPGDADSNGRVDTDDLGRLLSHWGRTGTWAQGDLNGDGKVDTDDLGLLLSGWGQSLL